MPFHLISLYANFNHFYSKLLQVIEKDLQKQESINKRNKEEMEV